MKIINHTGETMKIINLKQGTPEWHSWRQSGIGGSDIAAIMGKSPWKNAKDIFEDKLGLREDYSNPAMQRGTRYEREARESIERLAGCTYKPTCVEHEEYPFMRASLDGLCIDTTNPLIEIKVPGQKNISSYAVEVPEHYVIQIQWQLLVTGLTHCIFCAYSPESGSTYFHTIFRDEKLIEQLKQSAIEFWDNLQQGMTPEGKDEDYIVIDDPEAKKWAIQYQLADMEEKDIKKQKELLKKRLIDLGDDGNFKVDKLTFTRTSPRESYDLEAMRRDGIDIEKYKKKSGSIGFYTVRVEK